MFLSEGKTEKSQFACIEYEHHNGQTMIGDCKDIRVVEKNYSMMFLSD